MYTVYVANMTAIRIFNICCIWLECATFVAIATVSSAQKQYILTQDDRGFNVSADRILLLRHTVDSPMVYVGRVDTRFTEFRGNFRVSNYVHDRIGLPTFNVVSSASADVVTLSFGTFSLAMTLESKNGHPVVMSFVNHGAAYTGMWVRVHAETGERVYGCGEQYSHLDLRGRVYPIWTREQGTRQWRYWTVNDTLNTIISVGRNKSTLVTFYADNLAGSGGDYYTTYFPQPTFMSSRHFYCHYTGSSYSEFDFQQTTFHEIFVTGDVKELYLQTATSIKLLVQRLTSFLGRQPELPEWVYSGMILGLQDGTDVMLRRYNESVKNGVEVSGIWIQDWAGTVTTSFGKRLFWDWKWDSQLYPGLDTAIKDLRQRDVRVLAYINPNLNIKGDLYKEGAQHGFFIKNSTGLPYITDFGEFYCATVDLTNPAAYHWYKGGNIQKYMIDFGLSGWMADFGEYLPADGAYLYNNQSGRTLHNQWPVLWAQVNREAIEERNKTGDVVFWMRAGSSGTGKYTPFMWAGDQNVDFSSADGLPSTIPAVLNMGMSGVGMSHFDVGGYTTFAEFGLVRTAELLLRSAEAAIFTPMFRSHEGNQPEANVQFYSNFVIEQQFGRLSHIFAQLSNYTRSLVAENARLGTPVQRPLFMEFPDDATSWEITYQYMYGPDVLVAPVLQPNVTYMEVYLPPSNWTLLWSGKTYSGGNYVNVSAPLGQPPSFYKSNSTFRDIFETIRSRYHLDQHVDWLI